MSRLPFDYDADDWGCDEYEFEAEFQEEGLFDDYEGSDLSDLEGTGLVPVPQAAPQAREGGLRDLVEGEYGAEEERSYGLPAALSVVNQWDLIEGHAVYFHPWYVQYEQERQYDRYWDDHGWQKLRHRKLKKEKYWKDPERSRLVGRQKSKKHYWSDPEKAREATRKRVAAYRARKKAEKEAEQ